VGWFLEITCDSSVIIYIMFFIETNEINTSEAGTVYSLSLST
jgi:hypothetical protein